MSACISPCVLKPKILTKSLRTLCAENAEFSESRLACSLLGRDIPMVTVGNGKKYTLIVGAHRGNEWMTSWILLRFLFDLADAIRHDSVPSGYRMPLFLRERKVFFVPMLNPDGVSLVESGIPRGCILRERLLKMNGENDFSEWRANGRGVDLAHNYDAGFSSYKEVEREFSIPEGARFGYAGPFPESEPETHALADTVRTLGPRLVLSLEGVGEEIGVSGGALTIGESLSRMTGYRTVKPLGSEYFGNFCAYTGENLGIPSITVKCGKEEKPMPETDFPAIYFRLRRALFAALMM